MKRTRCPKCKRITYKSEYLKNTYLDKVYSGKNKRTAKSIGFGYAGTFVRHKHK